MSGCHNNTYRGYNDSRFHNSHDEIIKCRKLKKMQKYETGTKKENLKISPMIRSKYQKHYSPLTLGIDCH